jgi:DNA-binding GntR family transcriptional regulator
VSPQPVLVVRSLREQVYEYLRDRITRGELQPEVFIDLGRISRELGISKTPLRDAMIQLQAEGLVSILPRRGVVVKALTLDEIRHVYEVIGALEGAALESVHERIEPAHVEGMRSLNSEMVESLRADQFDVYYDLNLSFHDVYLTLSENQILVRTVQAMKRRLYDFPARRRFVKEWEVASTGEHETLVDLLQRGDSRGAAEHLRAVHWSFAAQERFIHRFYFADEDAAMGAPRVG